MNRIFKKNTDLIKIIIFINITDATKRFLEVKADSHFVKTSLYGKAKQVLNGTNLLILTGYPGEGKTAMAAHLALEGEGKKEICIKLESVHDWKYVDLSLRYCTTVIIDDIFGEISLDHERLREWKTVLNDIEQRATKRELRVIITSRRYIKEEAIYEMDKITMFHKTPCHIVHLDSRDLSSDEMKRILFTVLERNGIDETGIDVDLCVAEARGEHTYWFRSDKKEECVFGFPECATLFATKEMLKDYKTVFFRNPEYHLKSYIAKLYKPNETDTFYMFIALVAVWAEHNHTIKETDLLNLQNVSSHIVKVAECFDITIDSKFVEMVKRALNAYTGFLVLFNNVSGEYTFSHNVIGEMVGVVLGANKPQECIKLCQRDFFMKRVKIDDAGKSDLQVLIPEIMYPYLCEKFIKLLTRQDCNGEQQSKGDLVSDLSSINTRIDVDIDILQHNAFGISSFKECFIKQVVFEDLEFRLVKDENGSFSYPLIVAACLGQLDSVKYLLKQNARIFLQDHSGNRALHHAAFSGHSDVMKELLKNEADVNARNKYGRTPLHCAAVNGHLNAVKTCLSYGADVNMEDNYKQTALHHATCNGHSGVMKELLDSNADVNAGDDDLYTPLHWAADTSIIAVKTCLECGADVNMVDNNKLTALHHAASGGHSDVMKALLDSKAYLNATDNIRRTPLHWAVYNGHRIAVKTCLIYGADVNMVDDINQTALHHAASNGHSGVMKELLESNADVNARGRMGRTPLHWAAHNGHLIAVKTCLSYDADVNLVDNDNHTALHHAASRGHSGVMKELLDSKADLNARDRLGRTPLHCAADTGHPIAVETCLSYGADVNMVDKYKQTALHHAAYSGHSDVMKVLLDSKAGVNARGMIGRSPLHWASAYGHLNAVKTCLSYGADVNARDNDNRTALQLATFSRHSKVMKELQVILTCS